MSNQILIDMDRSYSTDLRERVLNACQQGKLTKPEIATQFQVALSTLYNWITHQRTHGTLTPQPYRHGPKPEFTEQTLPLLAELHQKRPDATLAELVADYQQHTGKKVSQATLWHGLNRLKLTRKKRRSGPVNKTAQTSSPDESSTE